MYSLKRLAALPLALIFAGAAACMSAEQFGSAAGGALRRADRRGHS